MRLKNTRCINININNLLKRTKRRALDTITNQVFVFYHWHFVVFNRLLNFTDFAIFT